MEEKMQTCLYRVDSRMIPPVIIAMVAGVCLLVMEGTTHRGFLLAVLLLPFYYLGAEILARRIILDSRGITVSKFLRTVRLEWPEISSLDAIQSRRKLFIIIQGEGGHPVIITNTIQPFTDLVERLMASVPKEKVSMAAGDLLATTPSKQGPLIQAWIVCFVLTALVIGKVLGYG